jgi:long-chain acyl-CoA synthetase
MVLPLAKALTQKELYNSVEENDEKHRMIGIFAKNSLEWMLCDLAGALGGITSVTLYDTLGAISTEYIINQCELKTICLTNDKIKVILDLVKAEKLATLK